MKKILFLMVSLIGLKTITAQEVQYFKNSRGQKHLCGSFPLQILEQDTLYSKWYHKNYTKFHLSDKSHHWSKKLNDVEVDIYLGTWCGDTKSLVPKFVKLWDELGLSRKKLKFVALYSGGTGKYKQSPNREEKGKGIFKVPTFIFKRNGKEISRIVEKPINNLEIDVAQIALGYPSIPNYRGANYLFELLKTHSVKELRDSKDYLNAVYRLRKNESGLNSLGYMYMDSDEMDKAMLVFYYNTRFFPYEPNVYDSYAECFEKLGKIDKAIDNYRKVLLLDRSNKRAKEKLKELRKKK
ncbi:MAG: hypothetical protein KGV44_00090 [Flavobacteriaceae bacterium]|nr:hypothetical protein [Flavobacteriaceae bacterium]